MYLLIYFYRVAITQLAGSTNTSFIHSIPDHIIDYIYSCQLSILRYWLATLITDDGEFGFDSGEGASETATSSKEGTVYVDRYIIG